MDTKLLNDLTPRKHCHNWMLEKRSVSFVSLWEGLMEVGMFELSFGLYYLIFCSLCILLCFLFWCNES